ncbi:MAG TPA: glycosyltransferase family 10 [Opitutaceae bacterium]
MSLAKKQVLIRPLWDLGLNNRLFDTIYPWSLTRWRKAAADLGIALDSWDSMPLDKADCVWLMDLPDRKTEFLNAKKRARPGTPFVLQVMETPVGRPHNFMPANQALCDVLVTYQQGPLSHPNVVRYRLPHSLSASPASTPPRPFHERSCAIMVNSNRTEGFLATRKPGLVGLPGIGRNLSGWSMPWWSWVNPARGELYSWRRKLARTAEAKGPDLLSVVGPNWQGERISWFPLSNRRPYTCCISSSTNRKTEIISHYKFCVAVENYRGQMSYISEKIFDPIIAGSVPIYLGDENIAEVIPAGAFVDVRDFRDQRELLLYLESCSESEWESMRSAGQAFVRTEVARTFSTETFVATMNNLLQKLLTPHGPS